LAQPGDILMSVRAPVGPINFSTQQICIGRGLAAIRSNESVDKDFLFYFLLHKQPEISGNTGAVFDSINKDQIASIEIPLPSLEKQREIVKKLDSAFAEIDLLESNLGLSDEKANQLLQSLLSAAFTSSEGNVEPGNPSTNQQFAMNLVKLGELASIQTGKIDVNKAVVGGKYPFFTCSSEAYEINDAPFEGKAVLVAGNGDLNVKYYEGKFNAYQRTYFLFANNENELIPRYLYWFLESYVGQLRSESIGSTIKYIKMGNLTEAEIPLPSLEKQREIVKKLDSAFAEAETLKAQIQKQKSHASSLRHSLLSSAFTQEKAVS
jgi:type I restriction enzyme S subunit